MTLMKVTRTTMALAVLALTVTASSAAGTTVLASQSERGHRPIGEPLVAGQPAIATGDPVVRRVPGARTEGRGRKADHRPVLAPSGHDSLWKALQKGRLKRA